MFKKILSAVWRFIKTFFTKNLGLKIIALLAAVVLWAYVLNEENPYRIKTVSGVNISFEGEAELLAKGLCVRGDRSVILNNASVAVKTQIANYSSLGSGQINATISLRNISEARTYELPVSATVSSGYGVVQSITPATVTVEIDTLVKKTVPITPVYQGSVPEGYWADMDASTVTARIDIEGAKEDISNVKRAECVIDLSNATSLLYSTFDLVLYGADDEVLDSDIVIGTIPSATVRVPVYPEKYVSVDLTTALIGVENLADNHFSIGSVTVTPELIRVVGDASVLNSVEYLSIIPIDVSGQNTFKTYTSALILPEGVRAPDDIVNVSVSVDVKEQDNQVSFDTVGLVLEDVGENLIATAPLTTVTVEITGPYSTVNDITRKDIKASLNLSNLVAGEYDIPIDITFSNADVSSAVQYAVLDADGNVIKTVHVTVSAKEE